jgi:pyruvate-formate lyase-activating enzyme
MVSNDDAELVYHVTVLSNFSRGFDKYARCYDKAAIAESTFPDRFFVLREQEMHIGIEKARGLLSRLDVPGNRLIVLAARIPGSLLHDNVRTGRGRYFLGTRLPLAGIHELGQTDQLVPTSCEEAYAASLACLKRELLPYAALRPRTLSVLPVARACQAACRFCFSESSASLGQEARAIDLAAIERWMQAAVSAGAERFVITGGGEPGLLKHTHLVSLIQRAALHFCKVVLITNGVHLARLSEEERLQRLRDYAHAGLTVLALSRHHDEASANAAVMGLDTGTERVLASLRRCAEQRPRMVGRLICVLQQGGIATGADITRYLGWAAEQGIAEVCFKELYVSTMLESAYHDQPENAWARAHQVPLACLTSLMPRLGLRQSGALPWGAPLYEGELSGRPMRVAAYTEPSVYWERVHGVARSWNLMAGGQCLASLEDPSSAVPLPGAAKLRQAIPMVPA